MDRKIKKKIIFELLHSDDPRDLVESDSVKPRGKNGRGIIDAVQVNVRIDRQIYEQLKQRLSVTMTINALLQYAIDDLRSKKIKLKIVESNNE